MSRFEPQTWSAAQQIASSVFICRSTSQNWKCNNYTTYKTLFHPFALSCWLHFFAAPKSIPSVQSQTCHLKTAQLTRKKKYKPSTVTFIRYNFQLHGLSNIHHQTETGGSFRDTLTCHVCKPQNNNGNFGQCAIVLMSRNFRIFLKCSFRSCHHPVISCSP